jgi:uncharacterized protein YunC (DUF1805 family)
LSRLGLRGVAALVALGATGCGTHAAPDLGKAERVALPVASGTGELGPSDKSGEEPPGDPFWKGLERHEIPLEQTLLLVKGSRGIVACPYLNVESFAHTGEACAIVPAARIDGMLESRVTAVTPKAQELGIEIGMSGREALDRIR